MPYHRSEEHTSELQSLTNLVCRLLLEKKKKDPYKKEVPYMPHVLSMNYNNFCGHNACGPTSSVIFFFFNDTATTEIYTLSLHDALPILDKSRQCRYLHQSLRVGTPREWH